MTDETIRASLRSLHGVPGDSRIDLQEIGPSVFRATEVRPDQSIGRSFIVKIWESGAIIPTEEPQLSFEQARVFHRLLADITNEIEAATARGETETRVAVEGDYPELFETLQGEANINGLARSAMLPVVHALADMLSPQGWELVPMRRGSPSAPRELWAIRARRQM